MAGQDEILNFSSGFTVVGSHLAITSSTIFTATNLTQQEVSYAYKDYTAGHFSGSFSFDGDFDTTALSAAANYKDLNIAFTSALGAYTTSNAPAGIIFELEWGASNTPNAYIIAQDGAASLGFAYGTNNSYTTATSYHVTWGFAGFVGQYGLAWVWTYSATYAPIEKFSVLLTGALTAPRYFLPALSDNQAVADTISYTVSNGEILHSDPARSQETLSGYTASGITSTWANNLRWAGDSSTAAYITKDFGINHFTGSYAVSCGLYVYAINGVSSIVFGLLNLTSTQVHNAYNSSINRIMVCAVYVSASSFKLQVKEVYGGTAHSATATAIFSTQYPYFVRLSRINSGTYGTAIMDIAYDEGFTAIIETVVLSLHGVINYEFFDPLVSNGAGSSNPGQDVYIGNIYVNTNPGLNAAINLTLDNAVAAVQVTTNVPNTAAINLTLQNAVVAITAVVPNKASVNMTLDNAVVAVQATSQISVAATINLTLQGASVLVSALTTAPGTTNELITVSAFDKLTNQPLLGLTAIMLKIRGADTGKLWDFANNIFTVSPASPSTALVALDATNQPELYGTTINVSSWNGWISAEATYNDGSFIYVWECGEIFYSGGIRATGFGLSGNSIPSATDVANAVGNHIVDSLAGLTNDQSQRVLNALMFGKVVGAGTSIETFRNPSDTKDVCRYNNDLLGNRLLVIIDPN